MRAVRREIVPRDIYVINTMQKKNFHIVLLACHHFFLHFGVPAIPFKPDAGSQMNMPRFLSPAFKAP